MSSGLPFTPQQFFAVMEGYHYTLPWAFALLWLGSLVIAMAVVLNARLARVAPVWLAFLWLWAGLVYHATFFTRINGAAWLFAAVSVAGAAAFAWHGVVRRELVFEPARGARAAVGAALLTTALFLYPLAALVAGHDYPRMPTFGMPCPVTLYTLGLLAFLRRPHPRAPLLAPLAWSVVGASGAFLIGIPEDYSLLAAFAAGAWLLAGARPAHRLASA
jgi:hypothetical protein